MKSFEEKKAELDAKHKADLKALEGKESIRSRIANIDQAIVDLQQKVKNFHAEIARLRQQREELKPTRPRQAKQEK